MKQSNVIFPFALGIKPNVMAYIGTDASFILAILFV